MDCPSLVGEIDTEDSSTQINLHKLTSGTQPNVTEARVSGIPWPSEGFRDSLSLVLKIIRSNFGSSHLGYKPSFRSKGTPSF